MGLRIEFFHLPSMAYWNYPSTPLQTIELNGTSCSDVILVGRSIQELSKQWTTEHRRVLQVGDVTWHKTTLAMRWEESCGFWLKAIRTTNTPIKYRPWGRSDSQQLQDGQRIIRLPTRVAIRIGEHAWCRVTPTDLNQDTLPTPVLDEHPDTDKIIQPTDTLTPHQTDASWLFYCPQASRSAKHVLTEPCDHPDHAEARRRLTILVAQDLRPTAWPPNQWILPPKDGGFAERVREFAPGAGTNATNAPRSVREEVERVAHLHFSPSDYLLPQLLDKRLVSPQLLRDAADIIASGGNPLVWDGPPAGTSKDQCEKDEYLDDVSGWVEVPFTKVQILRPGEIVTG